MTDLYDENGRLYHTHHRDSYWLPHDERECDRLDLLHNLFYNQRHLNLPLHTCPLQPRPGERMHILDLGCGTGFWVIDMADKYVDTAEVIGTDLSNIQPRQIPANSVFLPNRDFNDEYWPFPADHFDLIHLSMITASAVSWPRLYSMAFRHLRPSTGYIEHLEFDLTPRLRGSRIHPDSLLARFWAELTEVSAQAKRPIAYDPTVTHAALTLAGYVDIEHRIIPVPWQYDPDHDSNYRLGAGFDAAFLNKDGLGAYALAPFSRVNQWPRAYIEDYVNAVCREVKRGKEKIESVV